MQHPRPRPDIPDGPHPPPAPHAAPSREPRTDRRTRRSPRPRHPRALSALTAVALATVATASTPLADSGRASWGPSGNPRAADTADAPGLLHAKTEPAGPPGSLEAAEAAARPCRLTGTRGIQMSEGMPTPSGYSRSTGEVRALNLMIDFPDAPGQGSALDRFQEFAPQTAAWFDASSYGRLRYVPEAPVTEWLRMPLAFSEYGIERGAPFEPGYQQLVRDIVSLADPQVDFSAYDLVNILVTPNAGPSALDTVLSVTFSGNHEAPVADGVPLANTSFVYSRQDDGSGSYAETGFRVLPHENGHVFGLPDLYTEDGGGSVGHWDIMSEDWGANNDMLGWHKWKLGWLDSRQIGCAARGGTTDLTLAPLASPADGRKLAFVPLTPKTGYAVEVRTRAGNDEAVCKPGVLIYRVDADVDTGNGPITVADHTPGSAGCTRRPNVHLELSDATFTPGASFIDAARGVRIDVLDRDHSGNHRIRITRP
ncbi:M6 family metalloprotease domain-containing protein [Streptomyces candidus]|uniref:M6 family metalloprotease domain-containing protein n=1 Tax=Streptomyces candidus TaxID=67283 RepID=UPI00161D8A9F|nr:M6 family metalloprotease domain-containing protein [Streptomyces candidus]GHH47198.1 M6 family metalloprotease domain-containing protein [Streptomyces candidus]